MSKMSYFHHIFPFKSIFDFGSVKAFLIILINCAFRKIEKTKQNTHFQSIILVEFWSGQSLSILAYTKRFFPFTL